jgi:type VI secretion system secreted protein VgrG
MSSTTRTFSLLTPLADGTLQFVDLIGHEAISQVSEFDIDVLSTSADIDSGSLLGKNVSVQINTQSSTRYLNGIATMFSYIGPDLSANNRFKYKLRLNSWLYLASKTENCRIYQELTPIDLIKQVLSKFGMPVEMKVVGHYDLISYIVQWNESDLTFVSRVAERYGLYWYTRHDKDSNTIVFCDGINPTLPEYDTIEFLAPTRRSMDQDEHVTELEIRHEVQSGSYVTRSYDYKNSNSTLEQQDAFANDHDHNAMEVFEWEGNYVDRSAGQDQSRVRREQMQLDYQIITARSNVRGIAPGFCFKLKKNPRAKCNIEYLILSVDYDFHESPETTDDGGSPTKWKVDFNVWPNKNRYYPPRVTPWPVIGLQTAQVVGPPGQEIWTNEFGEIRIAYHWDRDATYSEKDTRWIPVSEAWVGDGNASQLLPRIGDMVVVDHYDGDPDRPIVVSKAHTQSRMPPNFSKTGGLPANHALAGLRSKELGGVRYNQLVFDDTAGEIRTQLESEHAHSQLNLGYLTHPRNGSAQPRGEGFELRSDAWGALRAAHGLLLSTQASPQATGLAMSRDELVTILDAAHSLAKSVADFAAKNLANASDQTPQETLSKAVKDWGHGSNAEKGDNGATPVLAVSSPAGIAMGTPKSTTIATGQHIDLVAQENQHITAGQKMNLHAGQGISQFAQNGGIKSIANHGKHITQSQDDDIQITADKSVQITASTDHVMVSADKHVTLTSGGGYIKIADGNIEIHCPGSVSIKGANYSLTGPTSMQADLPKFGKGETGKKFKLTYGASDAPVPNQKYKITMDDGQVIEGKTDSDGHTQLAKKDQMRMAAVEFLKEDK